MSEARQSGPRLLYEKDAAKADAAGSPDVMEVLTSLAERTEELAEASVRQKRAEADLRKVTRELGSERKARTQVREQLEADRRELQAECDEVAAECRALEDEIVLERKTRAAHEAELKRVQHRIAALQQQLQAAWAQVPQGTSERGRRSWWSRLGS